MATRASAIDPAVVARILACLLELRTGRPGLSCIAAAGELVPYLQMWLEHEEPLPPDSEGEPYFWDEPESC